MICPDIFAKEKLFGRKSLWLKELGECMKNFIERYINDGALFCRCIPIAHSTFVHGEINQRLNYLSAINAAGFVPHRLL